MLRKNDHLIFVFHIAKLKRIDRVTIRMQVNDDNFLMMEEQTTSGMTGSQKNKQHFRGHKEK